MSGQHRKDRSDIGAVFWYLLLLIVCSATIWGISHLITSQ